jgi:hypothetical protein
MRVFLLLAASVIFVNEGAHAQGTGEAAVIDHWVSVTRAAIADVRAKLRPKLSEEDLRVLNSVEFSVDPTLAFAGNARKEGKQRTIAISAGVAYLMSVLGQSVAVGKRGNVPCMQTHMFRSIKDAIEGMGSASPIERRPVWNMKAFAQLEPACKGADRLIADDAEMLQAIGATIRVGLSLVILHEIAHQVLDHVYDTLSDPPTAKELRRSRLNEDGADRWAIEQALQIGEPFILATPYLLIMTATTLNNVTLEGEQSSTHPSGPRRALIILDALKDNMTLTPETTESLQQTRTALEHLLPGTK